MWLIMGIFHVHSVSRVVISYWKIHIVHVSDLEFLILIGRVPLWTFL